MIGRVQCFAPVHLSHVNLTMLRSNLKSGEQWLQKGFYKREKKMNEIFVTHIFVMRSSRIERV